MAQGLFHRGAWIVSATLALLLLAPFGHARADCRLCDDGGRACARAAKHVLSSCKRECRAAAASRMEKLACYAGCAAERLSTLELCRADNRLCGEGCGRVIDASCPATCTAGFYECLRGTDLDRRACLKGLGSCRDSFKRDLESCRALSDRDARRSCKRLLLHTLGTCLHDCSGDVGAGVRRCTAALRECIAGCEPTCGESFPTCGGTCPGQVLPGGFETDLSLLDQTFGSDVHICAPTHDGAGCECVPPRELRCAETHPQCGGLCPPGHECAAVEGGLACACRPVDHLRCGDATAPMCDGACPDGFSCEGAFGHCFCLPRRLACGEVSGPPTCMGLCPLDRPVCRELEGVCECAPLPRPRPCGETFPQCGGLCPHPTLDGTLIDQLFGSDLCEPTPDGAGCECATPPPPPPTACGEAEAPVCDGACPEGAFCVTNFHGSCVCIRATGLGCGELFGPPMCFGLCPPDAPVCRNTDGGCVCGPW
ncbi:MAG: hypothetical protein ACE5FG_12435 [Myxococcota bacterium]